MKHKITLCLLLILTLASSLYARPRTIDEAKKIAVSHYSSLQQLRSAQDTDFELVYTGQETGLRSASEPYYYVFNVSKAKGFVMVSGDDRILPVLGYSTSSSFDPVNIPSNLLGWLKGYEKQIDYILSQPGVTLPASSLKQRSGDAFPDHVDPMVKTEWGQDAPYNDLCPMDGNVRSPTGCVATALSQIMYYHKWPEKGQGRITYYSFTMNQNVSVNFEDYTFDWNSMTESYDKESTASQNKAVAELMYAAGTACKMNYSSTSSNTNSCFVPEAFRTYFGYDENVYYKMRDYYSSVEWVSLIKHELASGRPVIYDGNNSGSGHSFICDGYNKDDLFHINWGWNGWYDGYFQLDILNPYFIFGYGLGGFSYKQDAVIGIQKPTSASTKPEGALLQYTMKLSADKYIQGDSLITSAIFEYEGNAPAKVEIGLALYKEDNLEVVLSSHQKEVDPASGFQITVEDTIAPFTISQGEYLLKYIYRPVGEEQWKDVIHSKISNSCIDYLLKTKGSNIEVWSYFTQLGCTKLTADKELHQNTANIFRTKIKNLDDVEINPRISIYYNPVNKENELKLLTTGGIYLPAYEEKELAMPVFLDMEPGVYDFRIYYKNKDGYIYSIDDKPTTLEVFAKEDETANEKLNTPSDLKVEVSAKVLSVQSESPVNNICIFDLNGKQLRQISPDATGITLPLGWASDGVYVVAIKNATGWHKYKMIF